MTDQLMEIGGRLKGLRNIMDIPVEKMANDLQIDINDYIAYESGQRDFSFSFLFNAANLLGVDLVDIIGGESPKLTTCALVRNGEGYDIMRKEAYNYKHLAFTFSNKKAEPFLVTVEPEHDSQEITLHHHETQEFNYMVSGKMEFHLNNIVYELGEGDSVYFDASIPHAMKAAGGQSAKFIAVVIK